MEHLEVMPSHYSSLISCRVCDESINVPEGFYHCEKCLTNNHIHCLQTNIVFTRKELVKKMDIRPKPKKALNVNVARRLDLTMVNEEEIQ